MKLVMIIALVMLALVSCDKKENESRVIVVSGTGDITSKVNEFRNLLGSTLNTTKGKTEGRRELNWDGVPDMFATQKIPFDFFNPVAGPAFMLKIYERVTMF